MEALLDASTQNNEHVTSTAYLNQEGLTDPPCPAADHARTATGQAPGCAGIACGLAKTRAKQALTGVVAAGCHAFVRAGNCVKHHCG